MVSEEELVAAVALLVELEVLFELHSTWLAVLCEQLEAASAAVLVLVAEQAAEVALESLLAEVAEAA